MPLAAPWLDSALRDAGRHVLRTQGALTDVPAPDVVRAARSASRRLRNVVRVFGDLLVLDLREQGRLDTDLRWFGEHLGAISDVDVVVPLTHRRLDALPADHRIGPLHDEVDQATARLRKQTLAAWNERRRTPSYDAAIRRVTRLTSDPPLADRIATDDAVALLERAAAKADRRRRATHDAASLDRARTATRRLRDAAEAATPGVPGAREWTRLANDAERALGHDHELAQVAQLARRLASRFGTLQEHNAFTYGVLLAAVEQERADLLARVTGAKEHEA